EVQFAERRPVGTRILKRDVSKGQGCRPLATRLRLLYPFRAARNVTGLERRESRLASDGPSGREQRANPLVRGRPALQRVDELGNPVAAIHEPEKQLEIGNESSDRHRPHEHAFGALPDDENDSARHERRVHWLQTGLEPDELEIALGKLYRSGADPLDGGL